MSQINQHRAVTCGALAFSPEDGSWFSMCSEERAWVMRSGDQAWDRPGTHGEALMLSSFLERRGRIR